MGAAREKLGCSASTTILMIDAKSVKNTDTNTNTDTDTDTDTDTASLKGWDASKKV